MLTIIFALIAFACVLLLFIASIIVKAFVLLLIEKSGEPTREEISKAVRTVTDRMFGVE